MIRPPWRPVSARNAGEMNVRTETLLCRGGEGRPGTEHRDQRTSVVQEEPVHC